MIRSGLPMVDRIENLRRRQTHVDREKGRAHHRDREKTLKITVCIPIHDTDAHTLTYPAGL